MAEVNSTIQKFDNGTREAIRASKMGAVAGEVDSGEFVFCSNAI